MDECDALDGVKNRLIENPSECRFGILNLACETSASDTKCLTAAQVGAAQAVYASPKDLQTGQNAYPVRFISPVDNARGNSCERFCRPYFAKSCL